MGFAAGRFGFATLTRGRDAFPDVRGGGVTCMIGCAARAGAVAARSACVGAMRQTRASIPIQMKPVEGAVLVFSRGSRGGYPLAALGSEVWFLLLFILFVAEAEATL